MTDTWSKRAEAMRESPTHKAGPDLDRVVELCEPGPGVKAIDVATGGGHVARRLREAGAEVVSLDPAPGMQPDVDRARRGHSVCRRLVRRRRLPDRGAPLRRRRALGARDGARRPRPRGRPGQPLPERAGRGSRAPARPEPCPLLQRRGVARILRRRPGSRSTSSTSCARRLPLEPWLERAETPPDDAARVRELLADRTEDGLIESEAIISEGRKR